MAARRAAVRGRGRRPGPLAARRLAPGREQRRKRRPARRGRGRRAAAGSRPGRPRHRGAARAVGGDDRQRPGGPRRDAGAGHARAPGRAAPRSQRRQKRSRPGNTRPVRGKKRGPPGRGPSLAWPGHGCGARRGVPGGPRGGRDRRCRAGRHRQRPLCGLGRARPAGGARGATAARHRLGRALAAVRALVGPGRGAQARPVPAGHRRRAGLAGGGPGRPLAGRGGVLVRWAGRTRRFPGGS